MGTLVIGDIHGCYQELQQLLDKAALTSADTIVALGDIVDRGPETPEVLRLFQNTRERNPSWETMNANMYAPPATRSSFLSPSASAKCN